MAIGLRRSSSVTLPARAALRPRSSSAVGRSWRASVRSSCIAWFARAFVSSISCASSYGAWARTASSRRSRPVSDWFTSSWRSRAMRARSSSCAASAALDVRRRSVSRRSSIPRNVRCSRSTSSGSRWPARRLKVRARSRQVGALHLVDQALEGPQAALEQIHVHRDAKRDREPQYETGLRLRRELEPGIGRKRRGGHRGDDQKQIHRQDLRHQILRSPHPFFPLSGSRPTVWTPA